MRVTKSISKTLQTGLNTVDTTLNTINGSLEPTGQGIVNGLRLFNEGMKEGLIESVKDRMETYNSCKASFSNDTQRKAFDAELKKYDI